MSKDRFKGAKLGTTDGETGHNRLALRSFQRMGKLTSWLPGAANRDQEFREGYKQAFQDRIRTIRTIQPIPVNTVSGATASTSQGVSMSNETSFIHQVELLSNLKQYLNDFQERLLGVSANYANKVDALHGAGMMEETYQAFSARELSETRAMIQRLVDHIEANDIPAVEKEINYLSQKL